MMSSMTPATFQALVKLLKEFESEKILSAVEMLDSKLRRSESELLLSVAEHFLTITKHQEFFEDLVRHFWCVRGLKPFNKHVIKSLMHVIIFVLTDDDVENYSHTRDIFSTAKRRFKFAFSVAEYFVDENNLVELTLRACRVFDNQYVENEILRPLLGKAEAIKQLLLDQDSEEIPKKPLTKPVDPTCFRTNRKLPIPPNTPAEQFRFKSTEIPQSTYARNAKDQERLQNAYTKNRKKAAQLLEQVKKSRATEVSLKKKTVTCKPAVMVSKFKPRKLPEVKKVNIKINNASLMREAATLVKDQEKEIRKIEAILSGAFNPELVEELEEEIRKNREKEYLQDITRKHLIGQLTYEEAILAKQNVVNVNKAKMLEVKEERVRNMEEIEVWKHSEQEKIKILVERSQNIHRAARDAEKKLQEDKQIQARILNNETKTLLNKAYSERQEELTLKTQLIQELRTLERVRILQTKEFDPTESANLGLLCEMSVAELKERLGLLKVELKEELERKRKAVVEGKERQKRMLEDTKRFIREARGCVRGKGVGVPTASLQVEQTPEDIIALRQRLAEARLARMGNTYKINECCCMSSI